MTDNSNIQILYEDNHIIAINKRGGDLSQGDATNDLALPHFVKAYIKEKYQKPGDVYLGVPHRLDRPVSGVILFARTDKALSRLSVMFNEHQIKKTYWAVTTKNPQPEAATLTHYLVHSAEKNICTAHKFHVPHSKKAILHYEWIGSVAMYNLLKITPETGRKHQIRAQLSKIGCSIVGDVKYGAIRPEEELSHIYLHARRIEFIHPIKKTPIKIVAPVPKNDPIWQRFREINT